MENEPSPEEYEEVMFVECDSCHEDFEITPENSKTQIWLVSGYQHLNFIALQHTEECDACYKFVDERQIPYLQKQSLVYYSDRPSPEALTYLSQQYEDWYGENATEEPDEDAPIDVESIEWNDVLYDFLTKYQPEPYEWSKRYLYKDTRGEL